MQLTLGHSLGVWYCGVTPFSKINSTLTFNNYTIIKNDRQELLVDLFFENRLSCEYAPKSGL